MRPPTSIKITEIIYLQIKYLPNQINWLYFW